MAVVRNEAGTHTRAQRRARLEEARVMVEEVVGAVDAADAIAALAVVALVREGEGVRTRRACIVYGSAAFEVLVDACETMLRQAGGNLVAAEQAKRENVVRGKRGRDGSH